MDEFTVSVSPVFFGAGRRLFDTIDVSSQKVGARVGREARISVKDHSLSAHLMPVPSNIEKIPIDRHKVGLEIIEAINSPLVTHLRYTVTRL